MAVVDSQLKVHGLDGVRVIDGSVFPSEANANLNAPTIMLAERASDMVRGRAPCRRRRMRRRAVARGSRLRRGARQDL